MDEALSAELISERGTIRGAHEDVRAARLRREQPACRISLI